MTNRSFKTKQGTELPLLSLRGKDYLEVKYRLVWFREEHANWSIETELLSVTDVSAYARAAIRDETGRIIATSHKFENKLGFPDFIEKAETGAIGRALALIGYGTQFCADELDEGKRIVDAPVDREPTTVESPARDDNKMAMTPFPSSPGIEPGEYRISFGRKYRGKKLSDIPRSEIESYVDWLESSATQKGVPLSQQVQFLKKALERLYPSEPLNGYRDIQDVAH